MLATERGQEPNLVVYILIPNSESAGFQSMGAGSGDAKMHAWKNRNNPGTLLEPCLEPCFQPCFQPCWNLGRTLPGTFPGTFSMRNLGRTLREPSCNLAGSLLEDCWNLPGTFVDLCWNPAGNFLERSWTFAGTSLEPCWNFCVSALVTVRCLVVILSPQTSFRVLFVFCCYVVCFISMILPLLYVLGCYKHLGQRGEHT